jgi:hypothetical protein
MSRISVKKKNGNIYKSFKIIVFNHPKKGNPILNTIIFLKPIGGKRFDQPNERYCPEIIECVTRRSRFFTGSER